MAQTQIIMSKPSKLPNSTLVYLPNGAVVTIAANGTVTVDAEWVNFLENAGFIVVSESIP